MAPSEVHRYAPALLASVAAVKPGDDVTALHQRIDQVFDGNPGTRGFLHGRLSDLTSRDGMVDGDRASLLAEDSLAEGERFSPEEASRRAADRAERMRQAIGLAAGKLPGGMGEKLRELAQPRNLTIVLAMSGAFAALQFMPVGWVLDALLASGLVLVAGLTAAEVIGAIKHVAAFYALVKDPGGDLDQAAEHLKEAVLALGVDVLVALVLHKAGGIAKGMTGRGGPPMGMQPAMAGGGRAPAAAAAGAKPEAVTGPGLSGLPTMMAHQKPDGGPERPPGAGPGGGGPGAAPGGGGPGRGPGMGGEPPIAADTTGAGRGLGVPPPVAVPPRTGAAAPEPAAQAGRPPDAPGPAAPEGVPRPPGPPAGGGRLRPEQQREVAGIGTGSPKEAEFVAGLAEQGAKRDEILRQLERLRRGGGRPGDRNEGLREALQTDSGRARNAAIRDDQAIRDAVEGLGTKEREAMLGQLRAHHLVPMKAVRDFPRVFGPAADAGWRPDAAGNLVLLPESEAAQGRLAARPNGVSRPYHDNPHGDWNKDALAAVAGIERQLEKRYTEGTPEWGQAARQMLEDLSVCPQSSCCSGLISG